MKFFNRRRSLVFSLLTVFVLAFTFAAVGAQTAEPLTAADYIEEARSLIDTFNLFPLIVVAAVIGIGATLLRRVRGAAR